MYYAETPFASIAKGVFVKNYQSELAFYLVFYISH